MQENRFGWNGGDVVWDFSDAEEWAREHDRIEAMAAKKNARPVDAVEEDEADEDGEWWKKHLEHSHEQKIDSSAVLDGFCLKTASKGVNPFSARKKPETKKKAR